MAANTQGDHAAARGYAQKCLDNARASGIKGLIGTAMYNSAYVLSDQGDHTAARELAEQSVRLFDDYGYPHRAIQTRQRLDAAFSNTEQGDDGN